MTAPFFLHENKPPYVIPVKTGIQNYKRIHRK